MSRKELLDARKALRGVREGVSGPRSKKQRGEWKLVLTQNLYHDGIKRAAGDLLKKGRSERRITLLRGIIRCIPNYVEQL